MDLSGYRKTSRTNIIATWVCAVILAGLSFRNYGLAAEFISTAAVMFGTAALITGLYFTPLQEALKGGILVTVVGLATLLASVLQGGSDRNFIASFFVLALATLYFDSRIILGYSSVYLAVCVAACLINPAYIDGAAYEMARVLIKLVIYGAVAAVLYAATRQGEGLIKRSQEAAQQIRRSSEATQAASAHLFQSVEHGNSSTEEMAGNISHISSTTASVRADMAQMLAQVHDMRTSVQESGTLLHENLACTDALSEGYGNVLAGVGDGRLAMEAAGQAIHGAADTALSANEATGRLLEQMNKVDAILKEIQAIASKTNLLSVNASIEAARSGVHGKGFAVVAEEIRLLAANSAAASADIQQIIDGLVTITAQVNQRVASSAELLQGGLDQIERVAQHLQSLEAVSGEVDAIIRRENELISAFQGKYTRVETQLTTVVGQMGDSVDLVRQIDAALQEQSAAAATLAAQLEQIAQISGQLQETMKPDQAV